VRTDKRTSQKGDKKTPSRVHKRGVVGYSKKSALLEEAINHMNTGKYGRSSAALKELLAIDPHNTEARRLFATLHLKLGSLVTARQAFESLANEAIGRQDYWLAESLLREYLAAGPRCVPFLELLAHVYQEKGDEMAAVGELGKAIEILRDDPDSENPQKAAQFYSKIRELAPASPVAFQLAPLFDVQTGEFLVRPSGIQTPPSGNEAGLQDSAAIVAAEHPLPEVMPWEVIDELPSASNSQSSSTTPSPVDSPDLSIPHETPDDGSAVENQEFQAPSIASVHDDGLSVLSPTTETSSEGLRLSQLLDELPPTNAATLTPGEPNVDEQTSEVSPERPPGLETGLANGISSPMPWEQVADASIQISEAEAPPVSDPHLALESILASLREQDGLAPPPVAEESPTSTIQMTETEPAILPESMEPASIGPSATLSSPMPWEQLSDAAMQIPEVELSQPTPLSVPEPPSEEGRGSSSSLVSDPGPMDRVDSSLPPTDLECSSAGDESLTGVEPSEMESSSYTATEAPRASSFSWNSVFDKAWKFAAGTMAPSPERERERDGVSISEENSDSAASPSPISMVSDITSAPPMPADSPAPELAPFVGYPSSEEGSQAPSMPAMPASFSTVIEEQAIPETEPVPMEPSETGSSVEQANPAPVPVEKSAVAEELAAEEPPSKPIETAPPANASSHWNTGEVAVQVHRPTQKKKPWIQAPGEVEQAPVPPIPAPALEALSETLSAAIREWKTAPVEAAASAVPEEIALPREDIRPDWMQASDAITFDAPASTAPKTKSWSDSPVVSAPQRAEPAHAAAASAVDVLFSPSGPDEYVTSHGHPSWSKPRPRFMARVHRIRIGVFSFIGSCFSTTRSLTFLALMLAITLVVVAAVGIGALGLAWMAMEEPPNSLYHTLTITPSRVVSDPKKNGYLLLLGFDAPSGQDPVQAGYERKADDHDRAVAQVCMSGDDTKDGSGSAGASAHVLKGWFRSGDPAAQIKGQGETIRSLVSRESTALARYQRWLTMPFDDWGYGQLLSPNCAHVLLDHRLFLLEGFSQDPSTGLDRLEADFQSWRAALGQSKTLMMKMLAVAAVQDDASLASGLLGRADLDGVSLSRLSKMVRPLDQVELSVRWPMQSHFVWAMKSVPAELKQDKSHDRPWHVSMAAAMRLPVQRRANAYAEYYEATNKAVAGGRYTNLPKLSAFVRTPATGLMDYLANPVEHIVGLEPLPSWDPYVMRMIETDAQLRLVGLQAWLRRGPQEGDVLTRLAKAGQAYYDPFTGLPMLVNQRKGLIYSVGRDGKDQEGDRARDVVVAIPASYASSSDSRRSMTSSQSR
jgi:hypothetical protein